VNAYYLASLTGGQPTTPVRDRPAPKPRRRLAIESLDGTLRIPLDGSTGWRAQAGATGLDLPPFDVATSPVPGAHGSMLNDVRAEQRSVFLPVLAQARTQVAHLEVLDAMQHIVDPLRGEFRLVGYSERDQRTLTAVYTGGLEGSEGRSESGLWWRKFGVTALACDPWASARTDRTLTFGVAQVGQPFLGIVGGTDAPWPGSLTSSAVIGTGMRVRVDSEVPVFPVLDLVGPMDSFDGTLTPPPGSPFFGSPSWHVSVSAGVPAGQTLRLVTDPRARSIRLGDGDPESVSGWSGALAAGRVDRGSSLSPFYPGMNVLDVSAPGGTEATRVRLSWRERYRSLW
jgi:hypothetical protein